MTEQEFLEAMKDRHITPQHLRRLVEDLYCDGFNTGRFSTDSFNYTGKDGAFDIALSSLRDVDEDSA